MAQLRCPNCGNKKFYVKTPGDESGTVEFEYQDGQFIFGVWVDEDSRPDIDNDTEIFCNACAWQGKFHAGG